MQHAEPGKPRAPYRPRLLPVFASADAPVVSELLFRIGERAMFPDEPPYDAVVVAITPEALEDENWIADVAAHRGDHLVPVAFGAMKAHAPAEVAELNWIPLDAQDLDRTADLVILATRSDVGRYRLRRALEADAKVWAVSGRPRSGLILDLARVRRIDAAIATQDPLAQPSGLAREYLDASRSAARSAHRKRIRSVAYRVIGAVGVTALFVGAVVAGRAAFAAQKVGYVAADMGSGGAPDLNAIRVTAGLVDASDQQIAASAQAPQAVALLAQDWPIGAIISSAARPANAAVLLGRTTASVYGDGSVTFQDPTFMKSRTFKISDDPLFAAAADGGSAMLVSSAGTLFRVRTDGAVTQRWRLPFTATRLAASADGKVVAAASDAQTTIIGSSPQEPRSRGEVLALAPTTSTVLALVADSERVSLVDLGTERTVHSWTHPWGSLVALASGDYDPRARIGYVAGPGRQLWKLSPDGGVAATGLATTINPTATKLTPQGWVLVANKDDGVHLLLPAHGIDAGRVCPLVDNPRTIVTDADGSRIACGNGLFWTVHDTAMWGPRDAPAAGADPAPATTSVFLKDVRQEDGSTMFTSSDGTTRTWQGPSTASALGPRGTAVVATAAGLAQVEATSRGLQIAWLGTAPGGATVTNVAWAGDDVAVTTADGLHWERRACPGCLTSRALIAAVAHREARCMGEADVQAIPARERTALGVRVCPAESSAAGD